MGNRSSAAGNLATLEDIRIFELDELIIRLRPGWRVLEIGGGSGFQAGVLAERGWDVTSVDLASRPEPLEQFYPVLPFDGVHLPFADGCFDVVFSSNVLEHVERLPQLLAESRRVLRSGGLSVHLVPSAAWRTWMILLHHPGMLAEAWRRASGSHGAGGLRGTAVRSFAEKVHRALVPPPHGEFPNAFAELSGFQRCRWEATFRQAGFDLEGAHGNGIFYTGHLLAPRVVGRRRRALARFLGSACHVFVVRSTSPEGHEAIDTPGQGGSLHQHESGGRTG